MAIVARTTDNPSTAKHIAVRFIALALLLAGRFPAPATEPQLTAAQKAKLDDAKKLNSQIVQLYRQGKYADATKLAEQVLAISKEVLGVKHRVYATDLDNLGQLYASMGEFAKAEPLYKQAIAIRKEILGEKNSDYANWPRSTCTAAAMAPPIHSFRPRLRSPGNKQQGCRMEINRRDFVKAAAVSLAAAPAGVASAQQPTPSAPVPTTEQVFNAIQVGPYTAAR